ncbi:MAG: hypothetical protein R3E86_05425 [Pseudomonadales bacterium]
MPNNILRLSRPLAYCALLTAALAGSAGADDLERLASVSHAPISEISGMTRSAQPDIYWVHNDSGDSARLFAIDLTGAPVFPSFLARHYSNTPWPGLSLLNAWNVDWEDITRGDDGMLYVGEMGNNGNARRDLGVYVLPEPDPGAIYETRVPTFLPVRYPDQQQFPAARWEFDCEALFFADGTLYFLTKHRRPGEITGWIPGTKLYRLDTRYTDRDNVLTLVSRRDDLLLATAAELSPDGRHLAVATYLGVWLFARPERGDDWLSARSRFIALPRDELETMEAITWQDDRTLLLANEERALLRLTPSTLP